MEELKQTSRQKTAKKLIVTSLILYSLTAVLPYIYDPFYQFSGYLHIFIVFSPISIVLFFSSILMTSVAVAVFSKPLLFRGSSIISFLLIIYTALVLPLIGLAIPEQQMHVGHYTYVLAGLMSLIAGIINEFPGRISKN